MVLRVPQELQEQVRSLHIETGFRMARLKKILEEEVFTKPINLREVVKQRIFGEAVTSGSDQKEGNGEAQVPPARSAAQMGGMRAPSASITEALKAGG